MWYLQPAIAKHIGQWATLGSVPCQVPIINSLILKVLLSHVILSYICSYLFIYLSIFERDIQETLLLFQERDNFRSQSWCKEGSQKPMCQQKVKNRISLTMMIKSNWLFCYTRTKRHWQTNFSLLGYLINFLWRHMLSAVFLVIVKERDS